MATGWKLPKYYELPWGYGITVRQVPADDPELEGRHAAWDVDTQTIWINRDAPIAEKRGAFLHEFRDHALGDWSVWVAQSVRVKIPDASEEDNGDEEEDPAHT